MMKQRLIALVLAALTVLALTGCQKASDKMDEAVYGALDKVENATQKASEYGSAQEIVDIYSAKMTKQAKKLGKELKAEAPARYQQDGTLAKLLKDKTGVLADLYGKGSAEISTYMLYAENGEESASPYIDELYKAYTDATNLLMDDYEAALKTVR